MLSTSNLANTTEELWPPKPNELDMAAVTSISCITFGTVFHPSTSSIRSTCRGKYFSPSVKGHSQAAASDLVEGWVDLPSGDSLNGSNSFQPSSGTQAVADHRLCGRHAALGKRWAHQRDVGN